MKKLFVSILHYGLTQKSREDTYSCLLSLAAAKKSGIELSVVLVDNNPDMRFGSIASELKALTIHVILSQKNLGFAGGHNAAIEYALRKGAEYVLVLNNDTMIDARILEGLLQPFEFDEKIGITTPKIYFSPGEEFHRSRYKKSEQGRVIWFAGGIMDWNNVVGHHRGVDLVDDGQFDKLSDTDFATGAAMLVKREILEKVGRFDEKYFLYYEDADLSFRAKRAGFKIEFAPDAFMWHKNAAASGGSGSDLQDYYISRNRMLFGMRYAPIRTRAALTRESLMLLAKGRKWQKQGILDFYRRKFGRGSYPA